MDLPHRQVQTPVFMPVGTVGSVKAVPQHLLEALGAQIILGNTYHLYLRPGHETVRRLGGLHRFMSWPRGLLTDSGGFQVFSLNELRKVSDEGVEFRSHLDGSLHQLSPERSIEIQIALGADILMVFDECTEYPADRGRARKSLESDAGVGEAEQRLLCGAQTRSALVQRVGGRVWRDGRSRCSGLCRGECIRSCDVNRRSGWWRWTFPAMRLAG